MRPLQTCFTLWTCVLINTPLGHAADLPVSTPQELIDAIATAEPGDVVILAAGNYAVSQNIRINQGGADAMPIVVRAEQLGDATIQFDAVEGFVVNAAHWTFENLVIEGVCADDSDCEHAFHVVGNADFTTIRNNRIFNFNAHIKGNGNINDSGRPYPDDVLVEANEFYSAQPRQTSNPVTPIDVVGGKRWVIRRNFIHDFQKDGGNNISYAAFLKGNSQDGLFERNLVACSMLHDGGVRLGLSFGGGGTFQAACEDMDCSSEHRNGRMQNNIIANCSDVGIYLNRATNVKIFNNTVYATSGIDARFDTTSAEVRNNLLDGRIRERDGGSVEGSSNLENADLATWFPAANVLDFAQTSGTDFINAGGPDVESDYCGATRADGMNDIGAIEYSTDVCDTSMPFATAMPPNPDAGADAGAPDAAVDAGAVDSGVLADASVQDARVSGDGAVTEPTDDGCGCSAPTSTGSTWTWVVGMMWLWSRRRTRS